MGVWAGYMFLSDTALRPVWEAPWQALLRRRLKRTREGVCNALEGGLGCDRKVVARLLRTETVKQTLGRADWFTLFEVVYALQEPTHRFMVSGGCTCCTCCCQPEALIAAATGGFERGRLDLATLRAVCMLHGCKRPGELLRLPGPVRRRTRGLLRRSELLNPWFEWQRPEHDDVFEGHLGVGDTRLFLGFIKRAWRENWVIPPYVRDADYRGPFRDYALGCELHKLAVRAARFERPLALFMTT
jgi:hypothetical protein